LELEKALPRRLDWTPPAHKTDATTGTPEFAVPAIKFSRDLQSFQFAITSTAGSGNAKLATKLDADGEATKRRRIDLVITSHTLAQPPPLTKTEPVKTGPKKRNKSPAKKALTITGLATSHYGEEHLQARKTAPMLEYLTATQVNADSVTEPTRVKAAKKNSKPTAKGSRGTKKAPLKSRLVSPTSAMKTANGLDVVFGSASQLARDESPTLLRDTLEALKQSEICLSSDPISPQRTQPFSVESTSPQACRGTSRFVKRRNLWSAAGRDEDNALLHVDTVDLVDSPAVRQALAGKDVLLQPGGFEGLKATSASNGHDTPSIRKSGRLLDIDDIVTPGPSGVGSRAQVRSYHTSRALEEVRLEPAPPEKGNGETLSPDKTTAAPPKPAPLKPNYAGFSIHDLQKQITAYGFKAVKKREKMVELLDRCWEDKYGPSSPGEDNAADAQAETLTHGDFLSKVHDISARPAPKVKKAPRAKRKSEADAATPTTKEPKKRKKAEPKAPKPTSKEAKAPRKRTAKSPAVVDDSMDVYDLGAPDVTQAGGEGATAKAATAATKGKSPAKRTAKVTKEATNPTTPPPTLPVGASSRENRNDAGSDSHSGNTAVAAPVLTPEQTPPVPDIHSQIHAAIHAPSSRSESQVGNKPSPTWREKILMYDPIVLEDLTVWLNTKGFRAIGEDREVGPLEVRAWCEQNGVCCLWKNGWGGRRKGGDGGAASAVSE
jgi:hypothetical protein